jgi:hypothetical protein
MVEDVPINWPIEEIPNQDLLFMRVHLNLIREGHDSTLNGVSKNIFRVHEDGISTNWNKYSTPEKTRQEGKNPEMNGVIKLMVGDIRTISSVKVMHSPIRENRAHTNIQNIPNDPVKTLIIRTKLAEYSQWVIPLNLH